MKEEEIARINELAALKKQRELTDEEQAERKALHEKYIQHVKASLHQQLSHVSIQNEDGSITPLKKKTLH